MPRTGHDRRRTPTSSSSPPARRRGWAAPTSSSADLGGRPLLAWTLDAIAAAPASPGSSWSRSPDRSAEVVRRALAAAARWSTSSPAARAARSRSHAGFVALDAASRPPTTGSSSSTTAPARSSAPALVARVAAAAGEHGAAIPVLPVAETLKRIDGERRRRDGRPDRARRGPDAAGRPARPAARGLRALPAGRTARPGPTRPRCSRPAGIPVHVVAGRAGQPQGDRARRPRAAPRRSLGGAGRDRAPGSGTTATRSGRATPLALGGVEIAGAPRLHGHSDGDVALHAVADALLGAAGLGDLGRLFPADAATPRGHRQRRAARGRSRPAGRGRLAPDLGRPDDRSPPGHGSAGHLDAMRDADRRAARARRRRRSTSRRRPATSTAPRAPAGRSRRSPSPRSSAADDASGSTTP